MGRWEWLRSWTYRVAGARNDEAKAHPGCRPEGGPPATAQRQRCPYRALLVPLDGSPLAERALPFARQLAALSGARLVLVRAVAEAEGAVRAAALAYLEAHADVQRESGVRVDTVVPVGATTEAIAATVESEQADLIVMTTSGRFLLGHEASGLFAGLLARVAVPILLVRDWHDDAGLGFPGASGRGCIVVPLDGSPLAERALGPAADLAGLLGRELLLVRAVPAAQACVPAAWGLTSPDWLAQQAADAAQYLGGVADVLAAQGVVARSEVRAGGPVAVIHGAVREHEAALLALATHGETGLAAMPLGSVARQILWEADAPVVLVRPPLNAGSSAEQARSDVPVASSAAP